MIHTATRPLVCSALCALLLLICGAGCVFDQSIERREVIELLPGYAKFLADHDVWECEARGWIYQFGNRSKAAKFIVNEWAEGRSDEVRQRAVERVRRFFVDKESEKPIPLRVGDYVCPVVQTDGDGYFEVRHAVPSANLAEWLKPGAVRRAPYDVILPRGDRRKFVGAIELIDPEGLSVISDIDDTLRLAEVGDSKKVVENTILMEYEPVPGMAALYQAWAARRGAAFHYVSGSPLQMFPVIGEFLDRHRFPAGSMHLRPFSILNGSNIPPAAPYKTLVIARILADFPKRKFIFVGDSGEDDPEMYGELARGHMKQVERILIRVVDHGREASDERFEQAFQGLPRSVWLTFEHADQVVR